MVLIQERYQIKMKKMMNNITQYKNPYVNQYVAPYGYHFERDGVNYGRIMWMSNVNGITIEKDEEY